MTELRWTLPRVPGSTTVAPATDARFVLTAAPGFTARATVTVRTSAGATSTETVPLPEQPAGTPVGTWRVPLGVAAVQSAVVRLSDGAGTALDRPLDGLPLPVGGLLRLAVAVPGGDVTGLRAQVWSETAGSGAVVPLRADGSQDLPVVAAGDHVLTLRRADGVDAAPPVRRAVAAGQAVDLALRTYAPAALTVELRRPGGAALADIPVELATHTGPRAGVTDAAGTPGSSTWTPRRT